MGKKDKGTGNASRSVAQTTKVDLGPITGANAEFAEAIARQMYGDVGKEALKNIAFSLLDELDTVIDVVKKSDTLSEEGLKDMQQQIKNFQIDHAEMKDKFSEIVDSSWSNLNVKPTVKEIEKKCLTLIFKKFNLIEWKEPYLLINLLGTAEVQEDEKKELLQEVIKKQSLEYVNRISLDRANEAACESKKQSLKLLNKTSLKGSNKAVHDRFTQLNMDTKHSGISK